MAHRHQRLKRLEGQCPPPRDDFDQWLDWCDTQAGLRDTVAAVRHGEVARTLAGFIEAMPSTARDELFQRLTARLEQLEQGGGSSAQALSEPAGI